MDSSVLLDLLTEDETWLLWSAQALASAREESVLILNPVVVAETSVQFERIEEYEAALATDLRKENLPWEAAFLAGKAFLHYRRLGGTKTSPLPDFFIGAHAAVRGYRLLTRDVRRYRTYFPTVELIAP